MLETHQVEELISLVASMDRETLMDQFDHYPSNFPIDFTREFLDSLSLDRLQHIFLALCLQTQHVPEIPAEAA